MKKYAFYLNNKTKMMYVFADSIAEAEQKAKEINSYAEYSGEVVFSVELKDLQTGFFYMKVVTFFAPIINFFSKKT